MTHHTPGPWRYKRGEGRYAGSHYIEASVHSTPTVISGKDQIAQCHGYDDEVAANGHLIASAPELLKALYLVRAIRPFNWADGDDSEQTAAWAATDAAIAKAEAK